MEQEFRAYGTLFSFVCTDGLVARANNTRCAEGLPVTMHLPGVLSPSSGIQRIVAFVSFFTCSSVSGVPSQ